MFMRDDPSLKLINEPILGSDGSTSHDGKNQTASSSSGLAATETNVISSSEMFTKNHQREDSTREDTSLGNISSQTSKYE